MISATTFDWLRLGSSFIHFISFSSVYLALHQWVFRLWFLLFWFHKTGRVQFTHQAEYQLYVCLVSGYECQL